MHAFLPNCGRSLHMAELIQLSGISGILTSTNAKNSSVLHYHFVGFNNMIQPFLFQGLIG
jgi:hypothetical protein